MLRLFSGLVVCILLYGATDVTAAEPPLGGPSRFVAMLQRSQSGVVLLVRPDVAKDLELVPSQEQAVRTLIASLPSKIKTLVFEFRDLTEVQRRERIAEFGRQQQSDINEILLPHQRVRLDQIAFQIRIDAPDVVGSFVSDEVVRVLGLTDEQVRQIRSRDAELSKMYRNEIAQVRKRVGAVMLTELSPEQRAEWNATVGEPFIEDPGFKFTDIESAFATNRRGP